MKLYIYTPIGHKSHSYTVLAESHPEAKAAVLQLIDDHRGEQGYNEIEFLRLNYDLAIHHPGEVLVTPYAA